MARDYTKTPLKSLTPEQLDGIKHDYLYNTKLTLGEISQKWNITTYTYSRLASGWRHYYDKGLERPCSDCGRPIVTYSRKNTLCGGCMRSKNRDRGKRYTGAIGAVNPARLRMPLVPVKVPPLEIGRRYKFEDVDYNFRNCGDKVTKQGKLIQITDHFVVFDTGKYKAAVRKTDVLSVI